MDPLETLTRINLDDLVASFGWQDQAILAGTLRRLCRQPARKFAHQMLEFDSDIESYGFVQAARKAQRRYVKDVRIYLCPSESSRTASLPSGPILALSNHPGITDTLALFCALDRPDLKVIALDRPFLTALPNMSEKLFFMSEDQASRIRLVRQVASHLRAGGAALTFPAGRIEPDPGVHAGAAESLGSWTDSVGVFMRMAPDTLILPVLVRNVISGGLARNPLLKLKRSREERERLAAALQLLSMILWSARPVSVTVQVGRAIAARDLGSLDAGVIHRAVLQEMSQLIANPPQGAGVSVL